MDREGRLGGLTRRDLIKRSAVVGAAAWTAPVIIDSLSTPAGALTPPPCPFGNSYVAMYSPSGNTLQNRPGGAFGGFGSGSCTTLDPQCPPSAGYALTTAAAIGLQVSGINISHNIQQQNTGGVTLQLAADSCCTITNVKAHVHRFGTPTLPNDCPPNYCQTATSGGTYLQVVGGGYGTKSVTVAPNPSSGACSPQGVHWGSPNGDSDCNAANGNGYSYGQPFGFLLIELSCAGEGNPAP